MAASAVLCYLQSQRPTGIIKPIIDNVTRMFTEEEIKSAKTLLLSNFPDGSFTHLPKANAPNKERRGSFINPAVTQNVKDIVTIFEEAENKNPPIAVPEYVCSPSDLARIVNGTPLCSATPHIITQTDKIAELNDSIEKLTEQVQTASVKIESLSTIQPTLPDATRDPSAPTWPTQSRPYTSARNDPPAKLYVAGVREYDDLTTLINDAVGGTPVNIQEARRLGKYKPEGTEGPIPAFVVTLSTSFDTRRALSKSTRESLLTRFPDKRTYIRKFHDQPKQQPTANQTRTSNTNTPTNSPRRRDPPASEVIPPLIPDLERHRRQSATAAATPNAQRTPPRAQPQTQATTSTTGQ